MKKLVIILFAVLGVATVCATERTILLGPKTIGKAWRDHIVLEPRHFAAVQPGDVLTVYHDQTKGTAQGAFQNPADWQGIAPEYGYFGINGPFRLTFTEDILTIARTHGIAVGGHDYRILRVTLSDSSDYRETVVWKGPSVLMKNDWSASAEIEGNCLAELQVGDGLRLHVSKVQEGAAAKLMDFTWNTLDPSVDGMPVGENGVTWYIYDRAPILKMQLAGTGSNTAMRVGGKGYRLDAVGIVHFVGEVSEDLSSAQRSPKEYVLQPGELFHGEKHFPSDWSGNLTFNAAPFQKCTENDVLLISYRLDSAALNDGVTPQLSLRNTRTWGELTGDREPVWFPLDGNDVVYIFDPVALDAVKTRGFILTGVGFTLTRIELLSAQ